MDDLMRFDLQRFADDDAGNDDDLPDGDGNSTGNDDRGGKRLFTQEELEAKLAKRLARERRKWEQQLEEERKKAAMTEAERLRAEKEEAERRAQAAIEAANQRAIRAEARVQAAALGVRPERLDYVLRLLDLSEIEVGEDGTPDAGAIKQAVEQLLRDLPELKGSTGSVGTGTNPGSQDPDVKNPWSKEHFNLTEQGRIMRENPALAARLKAEAGVK